eukprot:TRINITY_DN10449_c0_g1_i2.p1 TRINITY_DN10449_c0_g1~~TRINITY_DN10449_c0_g1_i2.p1  ORF type:complete len:649 (+),score=163.18 TRINITY_DN10449_c0_g1_i2:348-2294(+)
MSVNLQLQLDNLVFERQSLDQALLEARRRLDLPSDNEDADLDPAAIFLNEDFESDSTVKRLAAAKEEVRGIVAVLDKLDELTTLSQSAQEAIQKHQLDTALADINTAETLIRSIPQVDATKRITATLLEHTQSLRRHCQQHYQDLFIATLTRELWPVKPVKLTTKTEDASMDLRACMQHLLLPDGRVAGETCQSMAKLILNTFAYHVKRAQVSFEDWQSGLRCILAILKPQHSFLTETIPEVQRAHCADMQPGHVVLAGILHHVLLGLDAWRRHTSSIQGNGVDVLLHTADECIRHFELPIDCLATLWQSRSADILRLHEHQLQQLEQLLWTKPSWLPVSSQSTGLRPSMAINWFMLTANTFYRHGAMINDFSTCSQQVLLLLQRIAQEWRDVTREELWNLSQSPERTRALQLLEDGLSLAAWGSSLEWKLEETVMDEMQRLVQGMQNERLEHVGKAWVARSVRHLEGAITVLDGAWDDKGNKHDDGDDNDNDKLADAVAVQFHVELKPALGTLLAQRDLFEQQLSQLAWQQLQRHVLTTLCETCVAHVATLDGVRRVDLLVQLYRGLVDVVLDEQDSMPASSLRDVVTMLQLPAQEWFKLYGLATSPDLDRQAHQLMTELDILNTDVAAVTLILSKRRDLMQQFGLD